MSSTTTQIIKQSICYRAKYKVSQNVMYSPLSVVPHPKNRGGDPVKSLRTMELTGTLVKDGYDTIEANGNGVCVEDRPAVAGVVGWTPFQDAFAKSMRNDPDMLVQAKGVAAIVGSCSHGHLNCSMRNVFGGRRGCACEDPKKSS